MTKDFSEGQEKHQLLKQKLDQLDFIKIENFCAADESQESKQTTHRTGENLCKSKNLFEEYTKNPYNSTTKKTNKPTFKKRQRI